MNVKNFKMVPKLKQHENQNKDKNFVRLQILLKREFYVAGVALAIFQPFLQIKIVNALPLI